MDASIGPVPTFLLGSLAALALHGGVLLALDQLGPGKDRTLLPAQPVLVWIEASSELPGQASGVNADGARSAAAPNKRCGRVTRAGRASSQPWAPVARPTSFPETAPETAAASAGATEQAGSESEAELSGAGASPKIDESGLGNGFGAAAGGGPAPRAQLLSNHPCAGYFPASAAVDLGEVHVDVAIDASGHAAQSSVLYERPAGQGFAQAARACARRLLFAPARDGAGAPVPAHAKLKLLFTRA